MKLKLNAQQRLPSLKALHTFEVAARCSSFTEAADELNVTLGAVSRQIRLLESELGVTLFHRKGNAVALNDSGKQLSAEVIRAFMLLRKSCERMRPEEQSTLKLTCTLGIASHWLAPRLPALHQQDPATALVIDANESVRDLEAGEADIAIRYSPIHSPLHHSRRLLTDTFSPLASPDFLRCCPAIKSPEDLLGLRLIHSPWKDAQGLGVAAWQDWFTACKLRGKPGSLLTFNSVGHALQEAIDGNGVVLGSLAVAQDALRTGKLVEIFVGQWQLPSAYEFRLCWTNQEFVGAATRRWVNLLLTAAGRPANC
ncbi:LysR family transcriptional regulator [Serratia fonticola]|uniref:LysR substrate-binding domain-containing protein n=1 Tax=Serratia fonticola TaxID=47917 RepID=UPI00192CAE3B|nr:LysR substrate-binding domain-containing protein [Serratia fonticola]MBL5859274.1 LysR family transcriptional regulator [Serratia fonticola]